MNGRYILENGVPKEEPDLLKWAQWFEDPDNRLVKRTELPNGVEVSTVFLGIDHNFGRGEPLLYETMVFGGGHENPMWRTSTLGEAKRIHFAVVDAIKAGTPLEAVADE